MNKNYEVEYSNLELRFDRQLIQNMITMLIEEGYSIYWNENEQYFIISIRSGRRLIKLKFERSNNLYRLIGTFSVKDPKLSELLEKMINDSRGHAVVKRFIDEQILIENIMFGEIIRTVEISGVQQKVLYQKNMHVSPEAILKAFQSDRVEKRIPALREELDQELRNLYEAMQRKDDEQIRASKSKLEELRMEWLLCEP